MRPLNVSAAPPEPKVIIRLAFVSKMVPDSSRGSVALNVVVLPPRLTAFATVIAAPERLSNAPPRTSS